jgi:hypothetical protein
MMEPLFQINTGGKLVEAVEKHLDILRENGVLKKQHELQAELVMHLARIAAQTYKGYAAAQVFHQLQDSIAALPQIEEYDSDIDNLAAELEKLVS